MALTASVSLLVTVGPRLRCCSAVAPRAPGNVEDCWWQRRGWRCRTEAYVYVFPLTCQFRNFYCKVLTVNYYLYFAFRVRTTRSNSLWCVSKHSDWLRQQLDRVRTRPKGGVLGQGLIAASWWRQRPEQQNTPTLSFAFSLSCL